MAQKRRCVNEGDDRSARLKPTAPSREDPKVYNVVGAVREPPLHATPLAAGPGRPIALLMARLQESSVIQAQPGIPTGSFFARRHSSRGCHGPVPLRLHVTD